MLGELIYVCIYTLRACVKLLIEMAKLGQKE
jgi:hypothetical protein